MYHTSLLPPATATDPPSANSPIMYVMPVCNEPKTQQQLVKFLAICSSTRVSSLPGSDGTQANRHTDTHTQN